jgi:hypothetical protein
MLEIQRTGDHGADESHALGMDTNVCVDAEAVDDVGADFRWSGGQFDTSQSAPRTAHSINASPAALNALSAPMIIGWKVRTVLATETRETGHHIDRVRHTNYSEMPPASRAGVGSSCFSCFSNVFATEAMSDPS